MLYMLSSFDLKSGEKFTIFSRDYDAFLTNLIEADIIVGAGPMGKRVTDTPMDTEIAHTQMYYSVMYFRDRAQLDAAYAHIEARGQPGTATHIKMYRRLTNTSFLCWEDCLPEREIP